MAHPNAIPTILRACEVLTVAPRGTVEVARHMGSIIDDGYAPLNVSFTSESGGACQSGMVVQSADGENAASIALRGSADLTVAELEQAFGSFRPIPRSHPGTPYQVLIDLNADELPCSLRILADLKKGPEAEHGTGPVDAVTVLRSIKF
jgi:hypothetical protein